MLSEVAPEHVLLGIVGNFNHNHRDDAHLVEGQTEFIDLEGDIGGRRVNCRCHGVAQYRTKSLVEQRRVVQATVHIDNKEMRRITCSRCQLPPTGAESILLLAISSAPAIECRVLATRCCSSWNRTLWRSFASADCSNGTSGVAGANAYASSRLEDRPLWAELRNHTPCSFLQTGRESQLDQRDLVSLSVATCLPGRRSHWVVEHDPRPAA